MRTPIGAVVHTTMSPRFLSVPKETSGRPLSCLSRWTGAAIMHAMTELMEPRIRVRTNQSTKSGTFKR
jgi:hypothetical protein